MIYQILSNVIKYKVSLLCTSSWYFCNHSLTLLIKHFTSSASKKILLRYGDLYCVTVIFVEVFVVVTQGISFEEFL